MADSSDRPQAHTLAAIAPGERVVIVRIVGRGALELCRSLRLRAGDQVRCRRGSGSHIWIESPRGEVVVLERGWARYIDVLPAPAGPTHAPRRSAPGWRRRIAG